MGRLVLVSQIGLEKFNLYFHEIVSTRLLRADHRASLARSHLDNGFGHSARVVRETVDEARRLVHAIATEWHLAV